MGRDYEGSGFPQEAVEWAEAAQGWLETEAGIDESIEGLQAMLIDGSDDRQVRCIHELSCLAIGLAKFSLFPSIFYPTVGNCGVNQAALSERFTGAEVQLMTYASSPIGGMNPRGHTGHIVFAGAYETHQIHCEIDRV